MTFVVTQHDWDPQTRKHFTYPCAVVEAESGAEAAEKVKNWIVEKGKPHKVDGPDRDFPHYSTQRVEVIE